MNDVHDFNVCSCDPVYHYVMSVCQNRPPRRAQPAYSEITIALWVLSAPTQPSGEPMLSGGEKMRAIYRNSLR